MTDDRAVSDDEAVRVMDRQAMYWAVRLSSDAGRRHLRDDLLQEGLIGAVQAARSFDPAGGVRFTTYAAHRVRGRMLDYIREHEVPLARTHFATLDGSAPRHLSASHDAVTASLAVYDPEPDDSEAEVLAVIRKLRVGMTEMEQRAVLAYFACGLVLEDVGKALGVSDSYAQMLVRGVVKRCGGSGRLRQTNGRKKGRLFVKARPKIRSKIDRLGMSLVREEVMGVSVVVCPHCGGERRAAHTDLAYWVKIGRVTPCKRRCEPANQNKGATNARAEQKGG